GLARGHVRQRAFGHRKVDVHAGQVVQGRDRRAGGDQRAGTDLADAEHARERRADDAFAELRPHLFDPRPRRVPRRALAVELRARDQLLPRQFLLAPVQALGLGGRRLGLAQRGLLLLPGEGDQHRALADPVAAFEVHLAHDLADLGGDGDRFARTRGADRLQGVVEGLLAHHRGGHRDRALAHALAAGFATTGGEGQGQDGEQAGATGGHGHRSTGGGEHASLTGGMATLSLPSDLQFSTPAKSTVGGSARYAAGWRDPRRTPRRTRCSTTASSTPSATRPWCACSAWHHPAWSSTPRWRRSTPGARSRTGWRWRSSSMPRRAGT